MDKVKDILLDENGLMFKNGDWNIDVSDEQHIEHIFEAGQGNYYAEPMIGINVRKMFLGNYDPQKTKQKIRQQLELDNYEIITILVSEDFEIEVNAERRK